MTTVKPPEYGTPEYKLWTAGAVAEHRAVREGMNDDSKQIYEAVEALAQRGDDADQITRWVAVVFTAEWTWRQRFRLAWELIGPKHFRRSIKVSVDPRKWWIGYYRTDKYHYVCLLPAVAIRWDRRS